MDFITKIIEFCSSAQGALMFAALWAISEFLASIPSIESNSIFQLFKKAVMWLVAKFPKKV